MAFWVEDGTPDPDVPWPKDWEVCGVPDRNPLALGDEDKRDGITTLAWPMYHVHDPVAELDHICSFLERMPEEELQNWVALQDRQLKFSCGEPEMDAADIDAHGFQIPGPLVQRVRHLRIQLTIGFHPHAEVIYGGSYGRGYGRSEARVPMLVYWVEEGKPNPNVAWPEHWEVSGYSHENPLAFRDADKQPGNLYVAAPMYSNNDPVDELQRICSFLERMSESELEKWLALQDRQLTFNCSDPEMDAANMNAAGFQVPGPVVQRIRHLRLRVMIGFHPGASIIQNVTY
jgi:hypothetical protein